MDVTTYALCKGYTDERVDEISTIGKFLSYWDCSTGLAVSFPSATPYTYSTGDFFEVKVVPSSGNIYMPDGTTYTGTASTTTTTESVQVGDVFKFDGIRWLYRSMRSPNQTVVSITYTDNTTGTWYVDGTLV